MKTVYGKWALKNRIITTLKLIEHFIAFHIFFAEVKHEVKDYSSYYQCSIIPVELRVYLLNVLMSLSVTNVI